jgi:hypothetical protein
LPGKVGTSSFQELPLKTARLAALLVSGGLCTASSALAQSPAAGGAAPPAAVASAPAPATPAAEEDKLFRIYGIFTPRVVVSDRAVDTFNQPNASAITMAGDPVFSVAPDRPRYTLQVAQSRIGVWIHEKGPVRGQLEVDFIDFTKSTPTVASLPRLRIARVDYTFSPGHTLALGQDWDLHAPLNAHGINLVGTLFQAGNTGFMRQQFKYLYSGSSFELGAALGFPAANITAKEAALEIGSLPTLAVRGAYKFGKSRVGVSAIATRLTYNLGAPDERAGTSLGAVLFSEFLPTASTQVRLELNYGQNTANLGLLSLAQGNAAQDLSEAGGFLSVRQQLAEQHALYGLVGYQKVLEGDVVVPAYSYPVVSPDGPPPFTSAVLAGTGPGALHNGAARLGYEFRPFSSLAFMVEGFYYRTRFALQAVDVARANPVSSALGIEAGALFTF